jgi:peptidoglycan hydrolase-like protein with peptidoglycan-binding domain
VRYSISLTAVLHCVVAAAVACSGDEESSSTTVTVTTTVTEASEASEAETLSAGPAVVELQQVMTALGYYNSDIDGVYGDDTAAGVEAMQEDLGITPDGIYGPETHEALRDKGTSIVVEIQTVLAEYGYYDGHIDGAYGEERQAAVDALQEDLGVTVDGRVGSETVDAFNEAVENGEVAPA